MNALDYLLRFPWVEPLGRTLLHFLWQGAIVGIVAWALLRLTPRRSPTLRHALAAGAMVLCLALPVGTFLWLARPWQPLPTAVPAVRVLGNAPTPPVVVAPPSIPFSPAKAAPSRPVSHRNVRSAELAPSPALMAQWQTLAARWAVPLWLAGVVVLGARLAIGWLRIQLWRAGATPGTDGNLQRSLGRLANRLGLDPRRVRLLVSRAAPLPGPVAMGVLRPVVLWPARLLECLPFDQIEALLAHELAHIRRCDYLWNLLASALEVALFYHPVVWFLGRELRAAREECCDILASSACTDRVLYARALAAVGEWRRDARGVFAPEAARGSLVTRVRRLLGLDIPPEPLFTGRNAAWAVALASVALVAAGILHSGKLMAQNGDNEDADVPVLVRPAPRGRVVNATGQPVLGARVRLVYARSRWSPENGVVQETQAGPDGRFSLPNEVRFHDPTALHNPAEYTLVADAAGLAPGWVVLSPTGALDAESTLTLTAPTRQNVEVVDRAGKPVAGAVVWLSGAGQPDDRRPVFRDVLFLPQDLGLCQAVTDATGHATLENLPDTLITLITSKEGFGDNWFFMSQRVAQTQHIVLQAASVLEGRVFDPLGQPVVGALVSVFPKFRFWQFFLGKTDAQGRYRINKIWSDRAANADQPDWGKYRVSVFHPKFTAYTRDVAFTTGQTITGFNLSAIPGTELLGHLLDPDTKAPVVGATVTMMSAAGRQTVRSDNEGHFHARVPPGELTAFFDQPPGGCYVVDDSRLSGPPSTVRTSVSGERFAFDLFLPSPLGRLGVVTGRVRMADGKPVAHGVVMPVITSGGRLKLGNWTGNSLRGVTADGEGNFTLTGMPIGLPFTLTAKAPGDAATGTLASELKTEILDLPDPLVLQPTIAGGEFLISDVFGQPRPNFSMSIQPIVAGQQLFGQGKDLKTDADGIVRVPHLTPGKRYSVCVVDERGVTLVLNAFDSPAAAVPPAQRRTLVVDERCQVRLLGTDGKPLPIKSFRNFEVRTMLEGRSTRWSNTLPVIGRIGPDALVSWGNIVGNRGNIAEFLIETDDGSFVRAEGQVPDDGTDLIIARTTEAVHHDTAPDPAITGVGAEDMAGRVVDPDGKPLAGATIELPGAFWRQDQPAIVSDSDGVFRLGGFGRRGYEYMTIAKPGWATAFLTDVPVGKGFRVVLGNNTRLRGSISGDNPGSVSLQLKKNKFTERENYGNEIRDLSLRISTDAHGAYDFPIEPGRYRWQANSSDGRFSTGEVNVEAGKVADLNASLSRGYDVTFELVDCQSGKPVPGIDVSIYQQESNRTFAPREGSTKTSDAEGRIHWENLPPGEKQFQSPRMHGGFPGIPQYPYARWWRADEPVDWRRVDYAKAPPTGDLSAFEIYVDVKEALPPVRVLMERGVKIAGRIVGPNGEVAGSLIVQAVAHPGGALSNFQASTEADGKFLAYLPAGNGVLYNLCAFAWPEQPTSGANAVSEQFDSKPGDERTFQLVMGRGGIFTGRLVLADGKPAAGFKVTAHNIDELDSVYADRVATAGADGRYKLGPLRPGKYGIRPGTGSGFPLRPLKGATETAGEIASDEDSHDLGDLALPAGAKLMD